MEYSEEYLKRKLINLKYLSVYYFLEIKPENSPPITAMSEANCIITPHKPALKLFVRQYTFLKAQNI